MSTRDVAQERGFDVALGNPGEQDHNTLVLTGVDLVVPLERDLDGDPLQNDEVHLCAVDRSFERVLTVDDPDVRDEGDGALWYEFRGLPYGVYDLRVRVGAQLVEVMRGLDVRRRGVFFQGTRLDEAAPPIDVSHDPLEAIDVDVHDEDLRERFEYIDEGDRL